MSELRTERLRLRRWDDAFARPMAAINRDPEVTRYLNRPIAEVAVEAFHAQMLAHWSEHGFGPWGLVEADGTFVGFVGVAYPAYLAPVAARPEIGWRLARSTWGRGYATEAALAVREHAFATLALPELIAIIHPANERSQRVALKLGMAVEHQVHNPLLRCDVDVWALAAPAPG